MNRDAEADLPAGAVEVTSDFECGNGRNIRLAGEDHFAVEAAADQGAGHKYATQGWYFCVRAGNRSPARRMITVDCIVTDYPKLDEAYVYARRGESWQRAAAEILPGPDQRAIIRATADLAAGETVYLSNSYWYPPSQMRNDLAAAAERGGETCRVSSLGRTARGREIPVLTMAPACGQAARSMVVAGTPQSAEMGPWACRAVIEFLLDSDDPAARRVRDRWRVDVIPHTNPDGSAEGNVMVNSLGQLPVFEAGRAARGDGGSAEINLLWRLVSERRPDAYLEYHSYFQSNRRFAGRPYVVDPALHADAGRRELAARARQALVAVSDGPEYFVPIGDPQFGETIIYPLIERCGVIAHIYKLHMSQTLESNMAQAVRVFKAMVEALD